MKNIILKGRNKVSKILIGEKIENVLNYTDSQKIIIITDKNVNYFYSSCFPAAKTIIIDAGEKSKSISSVSSIIESFIEFEVDKNWFVLGIGGGVVCDITGFVATIYMRGLKFGFIATTLLCQTDAAIGGKNGINFKNHKNIIGSINQPDFVICDIDMLKTLPDKEIKCGVAEIVKYALIEDRVFFEYIEKNTGNIMKLNKPTLEKIIYKCINIKTKIVEQDEFDGNIRRKLNFGHTFGHAIESLSSANHGESISMGMMIALKISANKKLINTNDTTRIQNVLKKFMLPVNNSIDNNKLIQQIKHDKKRKDLSINFVLLEEIGKTCIKSINISEIKELI